jgi:hypothetical protein
MLIYAEIQNICCFLKGELEKLKEEMYFGVADSRNK